MKNVSTCSSGEPNDRHCTSRGIAPALRAASTGGNSDLDSKRLSSRRALTLFCHAPFPLQSKRWRLCQIGLKKNRAAPCSHIYSFASCWLSPFPICIPHIEANQDLVTCHIHELKFGFTYWCATADFNSSTAVEVWASKIDCSSSIIISLSRGSTLSPLVPTLHKRFARTNDSLLSLPTVIAFCRLRCPATFPTKNPT